jgi:hypothetical protein
MLRSSKEFTELESKSTNPEREKLKCKLVGHINRVMAEYHPSLHEITELDAKATREFDNLSPVLAEGPLSAEVLEAAALVE